MSVVAPGPVTDLTRVETRVSIRNSASTSQSYSLELFRDSPLGIEAITTTNVIVPANGQSLYSEWVPTGGHAGKNTIKYRVTPTTGPQLMGESSFQVVASNTRAVPTLSSVWIDPGAILPGIYFQTRPVTAQDVRDSIDAAHDVGVDTLIISYSEYILNNWGTFYPSQHYGSIASFDVVGTILNQASLNGQKVFVGLGRGDDLYLTWNGFDDPTRIAAALDHGTQLATELWDLYSHEPSFYGWYLAHEANDIQQASDAYYNPMTDILREFEADKPVMVSPSGTPIISPSILADSHVDIFAYQDAVGAGYIPGEYTYDPQQRIDMLEAVYDSYQAAHTGVDKHLWTNLESWQMNGPTYSNAYATDFSRLLQQIEIEKNYVDSISSYEWLGFFEHPDTTVFLGGQKALNLYEDYQDYYEQIVQGLKTVNYADNPGFEQGLAAGGSQPLDWQFAGNGVNQVVSLSNDGASGSDTSVSLDIGSNSGLPWLTQDFSVLAGAEYKFSAFVKELVSDPSDGWLAAQVWMLSDSGSATILDSTSLLFSDTEWDLQSAFITAPAGATIARLVFAIQDNSFGVGTGHYLIDGVSLVGPDFPELPGDFNGDFVVDDADLLKWQSDYGNGNGSDADDDGDTDAADFLVWQRNLGSSLLPLTNLTVVPEPASFMLLFGLAIAFLAPSRSGRENLV
ncbi:DUF4434 domain-containing protein [Bythopirellula goksoeyrii]|nr:DUF4434 domain-containing protein [Bythopirellula goksoeyrii]